MKQDLQTPSQDETPDERLTYSSWNSRLVNHFFGKTQCFRRVLLKVDEEVLQSLGGDSRALADSAILEARAKGVKTVQELGIALLHDWPDTGQVSVPPFVGILAIYVLAVNHLGDALPAHRYYDRLHDLLGSPLMRIDSLEPDLPLWRALESWSSRQNGGRLGIFELGIRGKQRFVGIPRRQLLLAAREEAGLRRAFQAAGLRPGMDPNDRRLVFAARQAKGLLTRTHSLLARWPGDDAADDLVDELRTCFEDWQELESHESGAAALELRLRLVLRGDRELRSGHFETDLVRGISDEDHQLTPLNGTPMTSEGMWIQTGEDSGRPIVVDSQGDPQWAAPGFWFQDLAFCLESNKAILRRTQCRFIVCERRADRSFEELDEGDLREGSNYLLVQLETDDRPPAPPPRLRISRWMRAKDLPGVVYAPCKLIESTTRVQGSQHRIKLTGGIPSGLGRRAFLPFALPAVTLRIPPRVQYELLLHQFGDQGLDLGSTRLALVAKATREDDWFESTEDTNEYTANLPTLRPKAVACELELRVAGQEVDSARFFIDYQPWDASAPVPKHRDGFGEPCSEMAAASVGIAPVSMMTRHQTIRKRCRKPILDAAPNDDSAGLRLMQILRLRRDIAWQLAKEWIPACLPRSRTDRDSAYLVDQVVALHSLGVLELEEAEHGGIERVLGIAPSLTMLPQLANRGMTTAGSIRTCPEALLIGCWLPDELGRLTKAAHRAGIDVTELPTGSGVPLAPNRRSLLIEGDYVLDRVQRVAEQVGVAFSGPVPIASSMLAAMSPIEKLVDRDGWRTGSPSDTYWKRFFDPRSLGVSLKEPDTDDQYILVECHERNWWRHFIVDRKRNQYIRVHDRQLGRWFVRRMTVPEAPIPVCDGDLFLPTELRLPRILERALVLSSGYPPRLKRFMRVQSPFALESTSRRFAIPAPPSSPVDWLASRTYCTGNFCCYAGVVDTEAWPHSTSMPMLGVKTESVPGLGLER